MTMSMGHGSPVGNALLIVLARFPQVHTTPTPHTRLTTVDTHEDTRRSDHEDSRDVRDGAGTSTPPRDHGVTTDLAHGAWLGSSGVPTGPSFNLHSCIALVLCIATHSKPPPWAIPIPALTLARTPCGDLLCVLVALVLR